MHSDWMTETVMNLQREGVLLVEDGNHGEYRPRSNEFVDEGVAFIRAADISDGRVLFDSAQRINHVARDRIRKGIGEGGDVLLSHKGTVGKVAAVQLDAPEFVCSPQTTFWRSLDQDRIDRVYLFQFLKSPLFQSQLAAYAGETDMAGYVSLTNQRKLMVALPPIEEQRAIAGGLGALDDKIELNRRMNRTLESMARALFKSWFVDFDPVHANAAGQPSLPPDLAALFPAEFEPSELGEIPKGWEIHSLDEIADYLNGLALQKYPPAENEPTLPVLKIAQLRKGETNGANRCNTTLPEKYVVHDGDVIFSWSGSLLVRLWTGGDAALNQHLFKVTSEEFPRWFYYLWTLHHLDDFQQTAASKATTMGHIKRHHLADAKVTVPPPPTLAMMTGTVEPILDQIVTSGLQSRTLAALRDTLLPKLLSGELAVGDALHGVEKAG